MASLNSLKIKNAQRNGFTEVVVNDTPIILRIRYIGQYSASTVVVTTATNIVLTPSTGTAVTCTFATYTTMGAVADYINNSTDWECKLLDALRDDASASKLVTGAITASGGYYDAKADTSAVKAITYRCSYDRTSGMDRPKGAHRVALKSFTYFATLGVAAVNMVRVYEYDPVLLAETQIYQALSVSAGSTSVTFASGEGEITSDWGNDLIVRLQDANSVSDTALRLEVSYDRE